MSVTVDVSQLNRLTVTLTTQPATAVPQARTAVRRTAAAIQHDAQMFAPVDTGYLRSSIGHDINDTPTGAEAEIGPTADYGAHVEFGTSRMAPAAYMGPAFDRQAPGLVDAVHAIATISGPR